MATPLLTVIVAGLLAGTHAGAQQPGSRQTGKTVEVPSHRVTGVVVDDGGQPVVNAAVALIAESYTRQWMLVGENTRTGPDGRFVIEGVASGVYWLTAAAPSVTKASGAPNGSTVMVQNNGDMLRIETSNGTTTRYLFYYSDQQEITVAAGPVLDVRVVAKRPTP
jgi:hypothetical protein